MIQTETEFISVPEAAKILRYTDCTVMKLARQGHIAGHQLPIAPHKWRLDRDSVLAYRRPEPRGRPKPPPKPTGPTPLELAIDRYESARSEAGAARTGTAEYRLAAAWRDGALSFLVAILRAHGKQFHRGGYCYESDGEDLYRYPRAAR